MLHSLYPTLPPMLPPMNPFPLALPLMIPPTLHPLFLSELALAPPLTLPPAPVLIPVPILTLPRVHPPTIPPVPPTAFYPAFLPKSSLYSPLHCLSSARYAPSNASSRDSFQTLSSAPSDTSSSATSGSTFVRALKILFGGVLLSSSLYQQIWSVGRICNV